MTRSGGRSPGGWLLVVAIVGLTCLRPAGADEPPRLGRDIILMKPTLVIGDVRQTALEFEPLGADEEPLVSRRILGYAPLAREIAAYRASRTERGLKPLPLYISLARGFKGTTYCVRQPFLLDTVDAAGNPVTRSRIAPVVHLSEDTLARIRDGQGEHGLPVLCHEAGHALMAVAYPLLDYPGSIPESLADFVTNEGHWYGKITDPLFAYSEGWAEFCEHYYAGAPLPKTLLLIREGAGTAARTRPLTLSEIRRSEGAQAFLMLAVAQGLGDAEFVPECLRVMAQAGPRDMNGLLVGYGKRHPERRAEIDRLLAEASDQRFALDAEYGTTERAADQADSWRKLGRSLIERLREFRKELEAAGEPGPEEAGKTRGSSPPEAPGK